MKNLSFIKIFLFFYLFFLLTILICFIKYRDYFVTCPSKKIINEQTKLLQKQKEKQKNKEVIIQIIKNNINKTYI